MDKIIQALSAQKAKAPENLNVVESKPNEAGEKNNWVIGLTGGGAAASTNKSIVDEGVLGNNLLAEALGIPGARKKVLFGQSDQSKCYSVPSGANDSKLRAGVDNFINTSDCRNFKPVLDVILGEGIGELQTEQKCVSGNSYKSEGKPNIDGPANASELNTLFGNFPGKRGDHVVLTISGHGTSDPHFTVNMGSEKTVITREQLNKLARSLENRGVYLHLNVSACYSGNFNSVPTLPDGKQSKSTCSVSSSSPATLSYSADLLFQKTFDRSYMNALSKFGNQFSAFACTNSQAIIGTPQTTLDTIVDNSNRQKKMSDKLIKLPCENGVKPAWHQLQELAKSIEKNSLQQLQSDLQQSFIREYSMAAKNCESQDVREINLVNSSLKCINKESKDQTLKKELNALFSTSGGNQQVDLLNRHLSFFKSASAQDLNNYMNSFCCLTYNFKTKKNADICQKYSL